MDELVETVVNPPSPDIANDTTQSANSASHNYAKLEQEAVLDKQQNRTRPRLLLLTGLQGSGKSTFAAQLVEQGWYRISQDELGSRQACERTCISALLKGYNVIIDRCNFDPHQRSSWIQIGLYRGAIIGAIVFAISEHECIRRIMNRVDHPTLPPSRKVEQIVRRTALQFRPPTHNESIDFCRVIRNDNDIHRVYRELFRYNTDNY